MKSPAPTCAAACRRHVRRRAQASGFMLIELIVASLIIGVALLELSHAVTRSNVNYRESRYNISGHWMADMIMHSLTCENLPSFEDEKGIIKGEGNVQEFLSGIGIQDDQFSEDQWESFALWRYEFTKQVKMMNEEGIYSPTEDGYGPNFEPVQPDTSIIKPAETTTTLKTPEELAAMPAARYVLVKLILHMPVDGTNAAEPQDGDEATESPFARNRITLLTIVDLDDFKEDVPDSDPYKEDPSKPAPTTKPPATQPDNGDNPPSG